MAKLFEKPYIYVTDAFDPSSPVKPLYSSMNEADKFIIDRRLTLLGVGIPVLVICIIVIGCCILYLRKYNIVFRDSICFYIVGIAQILTIVSIGFIIAGCIYNNGDDYDDVNKIVKKMSTTVPTTVPPGALRKIYNFRAT